MNNVRVTGNEQAHATTLQSKCQLYCLCFMIFIYICSHGRRHFKDLKIRFSSVNNLKRIKNRRIAIVDFKRIAKISGERKKSLKYQKRHFFVRKRKIFNSFRLFQSKRNPKSVISTINHFQSWKENDNNRLCHSHCGFERFIGYFETYFFLYSQRRLSFVEKEIHKDWQQTFLPVVQKCTHSSHVYLNYYPI